ncbi:MAG: group I intron-associated PD-(D/E)XK endonuclease [Candidatus Azambacteria bacterium]|nr:group I intron-associated PD-(D/E)XK endonuclease [Candidatus Azambacteria bacterium]
MDTKLKGDIAEQATILKALERGWAVIKPLGDRLPYDLVLDIKGKLVKIQIKSAWFDKKSGNFVVDNRRTKTNRRHMLREPYKKSDFDFAVIYLNGPNIFYVLPNKVFITYGSAIHFVEEKKRQRKPLSADFRDAWDLILQWATREETCA